MALILNIETSTEVCSVALAKDGKIISHREDTKGLNHAKLLAPFIDEIIKEAGITSKELDAVAVSIGPGSYTGLRIGVSMTKGLCFGISKPAIAVPTLQPLAKVVATKLQRDALYCPMIDAKRMEVYTALFNKDNKEILETSAKIITEDSFKEYLEKEKIIFFGNGSKKVKNLISSSNAEFLDDILPSADYMVAISEKMYNDQEFVDIAYFEPKYLKNFITTLPKQSIIEKAMNDN